MFISEKHLDGFKNLGLFRVLLSKNDIVALTLSIENLHHRKYELATLRKCVTRALGANSLNRLITNLPVVFNVETFCRDMVTEMNSMYACHLAADSFDSLFKTSTAPSFKATAEAHLSAVDFISRFIMTTDDGEPFFSRDAVSEYYFLLDFDGKLKKLFYLLESVFDKCASYEDKSISDELRAWRENRLLICVLGAVYIYACGGGDDDGDND